jgi:hypothetical protein
MFVDLLNSYNYLMVNMSAIKIFGLNISVYSAELLNIYKRATMKKKLVEDKYFEVDRKLIKEHTSLTEEEQLACDVNLKKINLISYLKDDNPNLISFDLEAFASLITSEDMKLIKRISDNVKINSPKGTKEAQKQAILTNLKTSIDNSSQELNGALSEWVDAVYSKQNWMSKKSIELFQQILYNYTKGDLKVALRIVEIATANGWRDCQWAINDYEKELRNSKSQVRTTIQKVATQDTIGGEVF